jgi:hypothetical protein
LLKEHGVIILNFIQMYIIYLIFITQSEKNSSFVNLHQEYVFILIRGAVVAMIVWYLDLQLHVQSVPITTKVVSSKPRSQRGVLDTPLSDKVCRWFPLGTLVSCTNKTNRRDITEILLKVALNTINQPNQPIILIMCR